MGFVPAA
jgi:hypothetical protein